MEFEPSGKVFDLACDRHEIPFSHLPEVADSDLPACKQLALTSFRAFDVDYDDGGVSYGYALLVHGM